MSIKIILVLRTEYERSFSSMNVWISHQHAKLRTDHLSTPLIHPQSICGDIVSHAGRRIENTPCRKKRVVDRKKVVIT